MLDRSPTSLVSRAGFTGIVVCGLLCLAVDRASATTLSFGASHDTTVFQNNVNNSAGGGAGLFAGTNSGLPPSPRHAMVEFNTSSIPSGATITDVQLRLVIGQIAGSGGGGGSTSPTISLYKMDVSWGEGTTGFSGAGSVSGGGNGSPAAVGDATWNARFYDPTSPTLWGQGGGKPGTDFDSAASASLVQGNAAGSVSVWDSAVSGNSKLLTDVQSWVNGTATNNGWMLINADETDAQTFRAFYSKDYNPPSTDPNFGNLANLVPQLTVTFTVPEPSGVLLLSLAMGLFATVRWTGRRRSV